METTTKGDCKPDLVTNTCDCKVIWRKLGEDAVFMLAKVLVLYGIHRDFGIKKAWVGE